MLAAETGMGAVGATDALVGPRGLRCASGRGAMPETLRPPPLGAASRRRAKRWAARLRKRWCGRFAKVPVAEHVDAAELRAKAALAK